MRETKLLATRQITRRRNTALWLLGIGLIVSAISPLLFDFFRTSIYESGEMDRIMLYSWFQSGSRTVLYLLIIGGLILIKRFENRNVSRWSRSWIFAYLLLIIGDYVYGPLHKVILSIMGYSSDGLPFWIAGIIRNLLFFIIPFVYMFWSIDAARRNSCDAMVLYRVRAIQSCIALILFMELVIYLSFGVSNYNRIFRTHICEGGGFFAYILVVIPQIILFGHLKQLIRSSSLFASTSEELAQFGEQPLQKHVAFPLSVCGLMVAMMACLGMAWLLTVYWNELYYEIF